MFTDDQFNIPDKFDETFHILGKGNGIPDILDEAMWGTMFWEYMQETNGADPLGHRNQGVFALHHLRERPDPLRHRSAAIRNRPASPPACSCTWPA